MKDPQFKRLSIAINDGKVVMMVLSAKTMSAALDQEITYYLRNGRTPAEIDISRED